MAQAYAKSRLILLFPLLTFIVSLGLFGLAIVNGWFGPAQGVAGEFCEASRPGLIKQPANTWSNIGFILIGLYIARQLINGKYDANSNSLTRHLFYACFYPSLVVFLGPGSMAMHATTTNAGGFFDMLSMYLIAAFMVAYAAERFFRLRPLHFSIMFCIILITCLFAHFSGIHFIFDFFGVTVFAIYIGIAILLEALNIYVRKLEHQSRWAYYGLGSLFLAFLIWNLSKTGAPFCDPSSLIQGHAIWHILDALALFFLFRYYVSEHIEHV